MLQIDPWIYPLLLLLSISSITYATISAFTISRQTGKIRRNNIVAGDIHFTLAEVILLALGVIFLVLLGQKVTLQVNSIFALIHTIKFAIFVFAARIMTAMVSLIVGFIIALFAVIIEKRNATLLKVAFYNPALHDTIIPKIWYNQGVCMGLNLVAIIPFTIIILVAINGLFK